MKDQNVNWRHHRYDLDVDYCEAAEAPLLAFLSENTVNFGMAAIGIEFQKLDIFIAGLIGEIHKEFPWKNLMIHFKRS